MRWLSGAALLLFLPGAMGVAPAQSSRPGDLAAGKLLVASRDLPDPNFAKTVVLLVEFDADGVVGLIVNRRSKVAISRLLEDVAGAKARTDLVYSGGPVETSTVLALLRSRQPPDNAKRVMSEIFLVSTKELLEKTFAAAAGPDVVRIYLGYAGWTKPQLENEVEQGAWYIFQGNAAAVFEADPEALWPRLIRETELRIASVPAARTVRQR